MDNFMRDLTVGKLGEKIIASFLKRKYRFVLVNMCDDYKWDLEMITPKGLKTFEIKTDIYEIDGNFTGNILIEISHCDKPSGIMATRANYFVYYLPVRQKALIIPTAKLRDVIKSGDYFTFCSGVGDGGRAKAVIAHLPEVEHLFKVVDIKLKNNSEIELFKKTLKT